MKINLSKITLIIIFCLVNLSISAQNNTREQYINKYKNIAIRHMNAYGIPASIILAQACLESGNGNSRLAVRGNNHFGIKCHNGWKGRKIYKTDDKIGDCFRKYISAEESFKDHAEFLKNGRRYQSLFDIPQTDYKSWARGLKAAGYATNPKYAQLLIDIVEKNNLQQYDNDGSKESKRAARRRKREERRALKNKKPETIVQEPTQEDPNAKVTGVLFGADLKPLKRSRYYTNALSRPLYKINGVTFLIAAKDDTYAQLAKDYKLFRREILNFNDLKGDVILSEGDMVYIERKKRKSKESTYRVKGGESLYVISQLSGIRLKILKALNNMNDQAELQHGTLIRLK